MTVRFDGRVAQTPRHAALVRRGGSSGVLRRARCWHAGRHWPADVVQTFVALRLSVVRRSEDGDVKAVVR
jgi:hypothetical protein